MRGPVVAVWGLLLNALVWGVSWWPFRALHELGLHPLWTTALIYTLALLCLLLVVPGALLACRSLAHQPMLWLLMLATGLCNVGFNWAVTIGDVVRVVLLFYLMPLWAVLLAWGLLGEAPTRRALLRLSLALAGVVIVLKTPETPWPLPSGLHDWLALVAGFCFALTNVLLRRLKDTPDTTRMLAMFSGGALTALTTAVLCGLLGWVNRPPMLDTPGVLLALLTSLAFLAANLGLQYGAARLSASTTALIMLTEVVFASLSSVLLGAAGLTGSTVLGGTLILLAALGSAWPERRRPT